MNVPKCTHLVNFVIIIIIIIIIKNGRQRKAERERERVISTLSVRSPQPHNIKLPTYRQKEEKGKKSRRL